MLSVYLRDLPEMQVRYFMNIPDVAKGWLKRLGLKMFSSHPTNYFILIDGEVKVYDKDPKESNGSHKTLLIISLQNLSIKSVVSENKGTREAREVERNPTENQIVLHNMDGKEVLKVEADNAHEKKLWFDAFKNHIDFWNEKKS